MRVLVGGPYPPSPDGAALDVLGLVGRLIAEGHQVEVMSPCPSAAEHSGPLAGFRGALALARFSRRFDALHLTVSRSMLFRPERHQARRVIDSLALGLALRLWGRTTVDLGDLSDVPGGGGGLSGRVIWNCVDEIVVSQPSVRNHVVKVLHAPASRVKVCEGPAARAGRAALAPPPQIRPPAVDPGPWLVTSPVDWTDVMAHIRARAAACRGGAQPQRGDGPAAP